MGEVTSGSAYCSERYACRANGALVDCVTRVRRQQALFFGLHKHLEQLRGENSQMRARRVCTVLIMLKATRSLGLPPAPLRN